MKISVIIPTYKPKDYLWECLNSLVNQSFSQDDFEVIIVLNGCSEPWKSQIEDFIVDNMQDLNVNFIQTDEGGVSNARNIGLDNARGKFITFIDDDDFVSRLYLENLYKCKSNDTIVLCYPYAFNDGETSMQLPYSLTRTYDKYHSVGYSNSILSIRKYLSGPCMKLIPKELIGIRRFDVRFKNGEDSLFMFLISDKIKFVKFSSKEAIYYRRYRESSATTSKRTLSNKIGNAIRLSASYIKIYLRSPFKYKTCFFVTRVLGAFKSVL